MTTESFAGAKLVLLSRDSLIAILRDDDPAILFPGLWDLPGGGREGDETPEACALRETREELGLVLGLEDLIWRRKFRTDSPERGPAWFFVADLPDLDLSRIRLGDEGQCWRQMTCDAFLSLPDAVPSLQSRLLIYLEETGAAPGQLANGGDIGY